MIYLFVRTSILYIIIWFIDQFFYSSIYVIFILQYRSFFIFSQLSIYLFIIFITFYNYRFIHLFRYQLTYVFICFFSLINLFKNLLRRHYHFFCFYSSIFFYKITYMIIRVFVFVCWSLYYYLFFTSRFTRLLFDAFIYLFLVHLFILIYNFNYISIYFFCHFFTFFFGHLSTLLFLIFIFTHSDLNKFLDSFFYSFYLLCQNLNERYIPFAAASHGVRHAPMFSVCMQ